MNHEASIAVVEDDESVRRALLRQFSSAGFHAVGFGSAADFKHAAHDLFDCVVLDVQLPMMDGLQLQAELKRDLPCASIVFITGHGDLSVGVHAMRQGAVDFLEKPVDDDVLLESVRRGVELSRKRRAAQARRVDWTPLPIADAARAGSVRPRYLRPAEQAGGRRARHHRAHHQNASGPGDGENVGGISRRAGANGHHIGNPHAAFLNRRIATFRFGER